MQPLLWNYAKVQEVDGEETPEKTDLEEHSSFSFTTADGSKQEQRYYQCLESCSWTFAFIGSVQTSPGNLSLSSYIKVQIWVNHDSTERDFCYEETIFLGYLLQIPWQLLGNIGWATSLAMVETWYECLLLNCHHQWCTWNKCPALTSYFWVLEGRDEKLLFLQCLWRRHRNSSAHSLVIVSQMCLNTEELLRRLTYACSHCRSRVMLVQPTLVEVAAEVAFACSNLPPANSSLRHYSCILPCPHPGKLHHKLFSSCCCSFLLAQAQCPQFTFLIHGRT